MLSRSSISSHSCWDSLTQAVCSWFHRLLLEGTAPRSPLEKRGAGQLLAAGGPEEESRLERLQGTTQGQEGQKHGCGWTESHISGERDTKALQRTGKDHALLHPNPCTGGQQGLYIYIDPRAFMNKHFDFSSYCFYSALSMLSLLNIYL